MSEKANPFGTPSAPPPAPPAPSTTSSTPFGGQPVTSVMASVKPQKSHVGLIIGLLAGLVGVIIVVVLVFVIMGANKVVKSDYDDAYDKLGNFYNTFMDNDLRRSTISYYDIDQDEVNDAISSTDKALDDAQKQFDDLGKAKAIAKDARAKEKYDKLGTALSEFKKGMADYTSNLKQVVPVYTAMSELSDIDYSSDYTKYYNDQANAYRKIAEAAKKAKVDDSSLKTDITDLASAASDMAGYYAKQANKEDVDYNSYRKANNKYSDARSNIIRALSTTQISKLSTKVTTAYSSLASYLSTKRYTTDN